MGVNWYINQQTSRGQHGWWDFNGKISKPLAAYRSINTQGSPWGVGPKSLTESYINLANPGVYNLVPGVAPSWSATLGWETLGSNQYLKTGIVPPLSNQNWSFIVLVKGFMNGGIGGGYVIGLNGDDAGQFGFGTTTALKVYQNRGMMSVAPTAFTLDMNSFGIAGNVAYMNGLPVGTAIPSNGDGGNTFQIYLMGLNDIGNLSYPMLGYLRAAIIDDSVLTGQQMADMHTVLTQL